MIIIINHKYFDKDENEGELKIINSCNNGNIRFLILVMKIYRIK